MDSGDTEGKLINMQQNSKFPTQTPQPKLHPQACCHPETTVSSYCSLLSTEGNTANVELIDSHKLGTLIFSLLQYKTKETKTMATTHKH